MPFAETYRATRDLETELEMILDAFESGWQKRSAIRKLDSRRMALLIPILNRIEDAWLVCRTEERRYHRHSFWENLGSIGVWLFVGAVGCAPLSMLLLSTFVFQHGTSRNILLLLASAVVAGAWIFAPRVPPWNVLDRRARAAAQAAEHLLEKIQASDVAEMTSQHHAALVRILQGCTNEKSVTHNPTLSLAALRAVEQIGDDRYIPTVDRLSRKASRSIRLAAQGCLPGLKERTSRDSALRALLRPSDQGLDMESTLVRPAWSISPESESELLLRPLDASTSRAA